MNKTEKQIRLCMRIMHRLIRRWYEEQGITRDKDTQVGIKQYGSFLIGFNSEYQRPTCNLTLRIDTGFVDWSEDTNVQ